MTEPTIEDRVEACECELRGLREWKIMHEAVTAPALEEFKTLKTDTRIVTGLQRTVVEHDLLLHGEDGASGLARTVDRIDQRVGILLKIAWVIAGTTVLWGANGILDLLRTV